MGRGTLFALAVLGMLVVPSTASAAPGELLDIGRDRGLPVAFAKGRATDPGKLLVRVRAKPRQPVEVTWDTNCSRGGKGRVREGRYTIRTPKLRLIGKAFRRADDCLVNVLAAYEDAKQVGRLKIELYSR
jgi:hypothetical protein